MQTYDYRPNAGKMLLAMAFFGGCTAVAYLASTDGKALLIDGLIYLASDQARIFWWVIAGLSVLMTLGGLFGVVQALTGNQRLLVGDESLEMPKSAFGSATVTIPYRDIVSLSLMTVRSQRFLRLKAAKKTFSIAEARLTRDAFEAIAKTIANGQERARDAMFKGMATGAKPEQTPEPPQATARPTTEGPRPFGRRT